MSNVAELLTELRERAGDSRNQLALRMGYARGTSLVHYETPEIWEGKAFPTPFVARLAAALEGRGAPPITQEEIWSLSDGRSALAIPTVAVSLVPIAAWGELAMGRARSADMKIIGGTEVAKLSPGEWAAFVVPDDHCARIAPRGVTVLVDIADRDLRDGGNYIIVLNGAPALRTYRTNPERWESLALVPDAPLYPQSAIPVSGRARKVLSDI